MEIESWVMADRKAFSEFLSIAIDKLPFKMDELSDPKMKMISISRSGLRV